MLATLTAIAGVITALATTTAAYCKVREHLMNRPLIRLKSIEPFTEGTYIVTLLIFPGNTPLTIRKITTDAEAIAHTQKTGIHLPPHATPVLLSSATTPLLSVPLSRICACPVHLGLLIKPRNSQSAIVISLHTASSLLSVKYKITAHTSSAIL